MPVKPEELRAANDFLEKTGMPRYGWLPGPLRIAFHKAVQTGHVKVPELVALGKHFASSEQAKVTPVITRSVEILHRENAAAALRHLQSQMGLKPPQTPAPPPRAPSPAKAAQPASGRDQGEERYYRKTIPIWAQKRLEEHLPPKLLAELKKAHFDFELYYPNDPRIYLLTGICHYLPMSRGEEALDFVVRPEHLPAVVHDAIKTVANRALEIKDPHRKLNYLYRALSDIAYPGEERVETYHDFSSIPQKKRNKILETSLRHFIDRHSVHLGQTAPAEFGKVLYREGTSIHRLLPQDRRPGLEWLGSEMTLTVPWHTRKQMKKGEQKLGIHLDPEHFTIYGDVGRGLAPTLTIKAHTPEGFAFLSKVKLPVRREKRGLRLKRAAKIVKGGLTALAEKALPP